MVTFLQVRPLVVKRLSKPEYIYYSMRIWKNGREMQLQHTVIDRLIIDLEEIRLAEGTSRYWPPGHGRNKEGKNKWDEELNWHIAEQAVNEAEENLSHESKLVVGPMTSTKQHSQFTQFIQFRNPYICSPSTC
jgi:hypothetical protein